MGKGSIVRVLLAFPSVVSPCPLWGLSESLQDPGSGVEQLPTVVPPEGPRSYLPGNHSLPHCRCCTPTSQLGLMVTTVPGGEQLHSSQPQMGERSRQGTHHNSLSVSARVSREMRRPKMLLFILAGVSFLSLKVATLHKGSVCRLHICVWEASSQQPGW